MVSDPLVLWYDDLTAGDVAQVGGKNASLGELRRALAPLGIRVPDGFAVTARGYRHFLAANGLEEPIRTWLGRLARGEATLAAAGAALRALIEGAPFPGDLAEAIGAAYRELCRRYGEGVVDVAVRSSATAEDLPEASFAGQQETFLNVRGEAALLEACRRCFASLFTDRAIAYRDEHGFDHLAVALSVGVQKMVRADLGGAGVLFTLDPESGFPDVVVINATWGLGENLVKGAVTPDEYVVYKPLLDRDGFRPVIGRTLGDKRVRMVYGADGGTRQVPTTEEERRAFVLSEEEILRLARWGRAIEAHYGRPMDVEWAKDGMTGDLYVVQARPETVHARRAGRALRTFRLKERGRVLVTGLSVGQGIAAGRACLIASPREGERFPDGAVLVTGATDPDWVPVLRRAAAIVTDQGGRTCHAAIVSRELGIPAVVGTGTGTRVIRPGQEVTVSCAEGERGTVYEGVLPFEVAEVDPGELPATRTQVMINLGDPAAAFRWWWLPADGVGLARMEFIIANDIKVHPMAFLYPEEVRDEGARRAIGELARGYADPAEYFVERLAHGIARLAAPRYPRPVIVRFSDFKTNEYAHLIGGREFEPREENPMLGFRGASRYYHERYRAAFALECRALRRVRSEMGLRNVVVMVPFCRTPEEADRVLAAMAENGLARGEDGLEVYVMCEIPANVVLAEEFARRFDGFSIGSNDLTQLVLGVDRDSPALAYLFDERHEAVKRMIAQVIRTAHAAGRKVGICGQAPGDHPDFIDFLVEQGIDSISVDPERFAAVRRRVAAAEAALGR